MLINRCYRLSGWILRNWEGIRVARFGTSGSGAQRVDGVLSRVTVGIFMGVLEWTQWRALGSARSMVSLYFLYFKIQYFRLLVLNFDNA